MANTVIFAASIGTMIAYLTGNFSYISPAVVFVDVSGVGYEVQISLNTYSHIQHLEKGTLHTYLMIKEDGHTLYGFFDQSEKNMFLKLISINGVGAATARMMLSSLRPEEIARAILNGNARLLESIKGIGKKTAERIVLELKDKLSKNESETVNSILINNTLEQDALNALIALGINRSMAQNAIKKAHAADPTNENLEVLIKKALQSI
jgi:holliday junction DNA helicase RuvA